MLNKLRNKKNNKGFTLVELLVVIAIIGILAVVAVPSLFKNINKAKAAEVVAYISAVKTEAMSQYADGAEFDTESSTFTGNTVDPVKNVTDAIDGKKPEEVNITDITVSSDKIKVYASVKSNVKAEVEKAFEGESGVVIAELTAGK